MKCDSYMPSCDGEDFSDTGQWYVATWCLMVDWNKKYSLGFGDERVRIERRWRWNHVAAEWESLTEWFEAMSVDSVSVWDEGAALQSCWMDCEAFPTSAYRLDSRKWVLFIEHWPHHNWTLYLHAYVYFSVCRQLGIKYKYLEFLAEGTLAMTTTSSTSLAIPMRQHVQSGERHLQDHDIHLQNHHN